MSTEYNSALRDEMWSSLQKQAKEINPQLVLDIAGIFDPTPISDGASVAISLWQGEFVDALLGGASMFPYLGDAAAKPLKIARRYGDEATKVLDGLNTLRRAKTDEMMDALKVAEPGAIRRARERAAEAVRNAQQRKRLGCNTEECKKLRRSNMPKKGGTWDPENARETGTGKWTFTDNAGNTRSVQFNDGYPDFGSHTWGGQIINSILITLQTMSIRILLPFCHNTRSRFREGKPHVDTLSITWKMVPWLLLILRSITAFPIRVSAPLKKQIFFEVSCSISKL